MLRNSISIRKAGDEIAKEPGFFEVDTVAHCGPTLKGEFARTVNFTDVNIGWVFTLAIRNNTHSCVKAAMEAFHQAIPYQIQGLDCDNGSEFINHVIVEWASHLDIYFTRSRPYRKNDQAAIESKNNHLVRRYGMYWRYDTPTQLRLLNQLWALINDRLNFFTPTIKPIGWATDTAGQRKRESPRRVRRHDCFKQKGRIESCRTHITGIRRSSRNGRSGCFGSPARIIRQTRRRLRRSPNCWGSARVRRSVAGSSKPMSTLAPVSGCRVRNQPK